MNVVDKDQLKTMKNYRDRAYRYAIEFHRERTVSRNHMANLQNRRRAHFSQRIVVVGSNSFVKDAEF